MSIQQKLNGFVVFIFPLNDIICHNMIISFISWWAIIPYSLIELPMGTLYTVFQQQNAYFIILLWLRLYIFRILFQSICVFFGVNFNVSWQCLGISGIVDIRWVNQRKLTWFSQIDYDISKCVDTPYIIITLSKTVIHRIILNINWINWSEWTYISNLKSLLNQRTLFHTQQVEEPFYCPI